MFTIAPQNVTRIPFEQPALDDPARVWKSDDVSLFRLEEPVTDLFGGSHEHVVVSTVTEDGTTEVAIFASRESGVPGFPYPIATSVDDLDVTALLASKGLTDVTAG